MGEYQIGPSSPGFQIVLFYPKHLSGSDSQKLFMWWHRLEVPSGWSQATVSIKEQCPWCDWYGIREGQGPAIGCLYDGMLLALSWEMESESVNNLINQACKSLEQIKSS